MSYIFANIMIYVDTKWGTEQFISQLGEHCKLFLFFLFVKRELVWDGDNGKKSFPNSEIGKVSEVKRKLEEKLAITQSHVPTNRSSNS